MFGQNRKRVLSWLHQNGPSTGRTIQIGTGISVGAFYTAAMRLEEDELVESEWIDRPALPSYRQRLYRLKEGAG